MRQFLDENLPHAWIGRRGNIEWPTGSPDLAKFQGQVIHNNIFKVWHRNTHRPYSKSKGGNHPCKGVSYGNKKVVPIESEIEGSEQFSTIFKPEVEVSNFRWTTLYIFWDERLPYQENQ